MTQLRIERLLDGFHCNPPASDSMVKAFGLRSGLQLPPDYIDFLKIANGGEGFIGKRLYLILWKIEDVLSFNVAYKVDDYVPGLILIGSDGGGEAFGFDKTMSPWPMVRVPLIGMDRSLIQVIALNFVSFLEFSYRSE
ncbi:MAG TPA: SMI1/KNR4 family protein [Syntrophobacteraceae bacterium]|nr:SMI1/KNR4 family protein [Syntrophobacteraceae bacterium]